MIVSPHPLLSPRSKTLLSGAKSKHVFILPAFETLPELRVAQGVEIAVAAASGECGDHDAPGIQPSL